MNTDNWTYQGMKRPVCEMAWGEALRKDNPLMFHWGYEGTVRPFVHGYLRKLPRKGLSGHVSILDIGLRGTCGVPEKRGLATATVSSRSGWTTRR